MKKLIYHIALSIFSIYFLISCGSAEMSKAERPANMTEDFILENSQTSKEASLSITDDYETLAKQKTKDLGDLVSMIGDKNIDAEFKTEIKNQIIQQFLIIDSTIIVENKSSPILNYLNQIDSNNTKLNFKSIHLSHPFLLWQNDHQKASYEVKATIKSPKRKKEKLTLLLDIHIIKEEKIFGDETEIVSVVKFGTITINQ